MRGEMSQPGILPSGRVLRYPFQERLIHWVSGLSYLYLMLTGLAFWSPWLFWIATVLGGGTISRELHPWVGLIFVISVAMMYRMWAGQMHETQADKAFERALPHYIRNEDNQVPPSGRFNAGQKWLFWGFIWCSLALLLSGLVLWFPQWISWNLRFLRLLAVLVHPIAALLTIGLFIIHVYMGVVLERGSLDAMVRGDVSTSWAKKYHLLWYDQLVKPASPKK